MAKIISLTITGRVQGVFFRVSTRAQARKLHLTGFVSNQDSGSVYIEASGSAKSLEQFVSWCHHGPKYAHVDSVSTHSLPGLTQPVEPGQFLIL